MKQKIKQSKKPIMLGLVCVMIAACFLSMSLVTGSFARFQETKTGSGTADIADWSFLASVDKDADPATLETTLAATAEENAYVTDGFIAPGSSGYVPIFVDITGTEVAMKLEVSATFANTLPSEIVFTDNFDRALTETVSGTNFVLAYSFYVPLSDVEAWNGYIDLGFNWEYPESAANDFNNGGASHAMSLAVKASQVVAASDFTGLTEINFVANASEISTAANVRNILLNNIDAIDLDLTANFELDLNEKAIGGDSTIDSAATVTAYLGTTRNDAANAGSFNNLVITAPNATVYQSANLLGNITVNSGDDCFYFTGDVAADTVITVAGGKAVIKAAPRTNNPTIVVNKDTVTADTKEIVIVVEEKATVESVSVASVPANATVTLTNNGTINDLNVEKVLDAEEAEVPFTFNVSNSGTIDEVTNDTSATTLSLDYSRSVKVVEYPVSNILQLKNAIALIVASTEKVGTIKLIDDVVITTAATPLNYININSGDITLDLNGYTLFSGATSAQSMVIYANENAALTITDSSADADGKVIYNGTVSNNSAITIVTGADVVLEKGSVESGMIPVRIYGDSSFTINGGSVINSNNYYYSIWIAEAGSKLYINDGYVYGAILGNGTASSAGTYIEINGGLIEGRKNADGTYACEALYIPQYGTLNINGGVIKGYSGITMKDGILNITGGEIYAYGDKSEPAAANNNGSEETGAAISITSNNAYVLSGDPYMQITISGGTFTSANGYAFYEGISYNSSNNTYKASNSYISKLVISGGTFVASDEENNDVDIYLGAIGTSSENPEVSVNPTSGTYQIVTAE